MNAADRSFESLMVGETHAEEHHIDERMVAAFAELSGDKNPLHTDESYAATTPLKRPVAHGMLLGALVSEMVGMHIPGKRCLIVKMSLSFHHPIFPGDTVRIIGTIVHKSEALQLLEISVSAMRADELVAEGIVHTKVL